MFNRNDAMPVKKSTRQEWHHAIQEECHAWILFCCHSTVLKPNLRSNGPPNINWKLWPVQRFCHDFHIPSGCWRRVYILVLKITACLSERPNNITWFVCYSTSQCLATNDISPWYFTNVAFGNQMLLLRSQRPSCYLVFNFYRFVPGICSRYPKF